MDGMPKMQAGESVDIPVQVMALTDRDGRTTPIWFRLEAPDHQGLRYHIRKTISRSEKNYVGIREKQFICIVQTGEFEHTIELRCNTETQRWRIVQLL